MTFRQTISIGLASFLAVGSLGCAHTQFAQQRPVAQEAVCPGEQEARSRLQDTQFKDATVGALRSKATREWLSGDRDASKRTDEEYDKLLKDGVLVEDAVSALVSVLLRCKGRDTTKDIKKLLKDESWKVKCGALHRLGDLQAKEYARDIANLLRDDDSFVSVAALVTLHEVGATQEITQRLKTGGVKEKLNILSGLGVLTRKREEGGLDLVSDENWAGNRNLLSIWGVPTGTPEEGRLGWTEEYAGDIADRLRDGDWRVRRAAVEALAPMRVAQDYTKDLAPLLAHEWKDEGDWWGWPDPPPRTRAIIAELFAKLGAREYAKDIAGLLNARNRWVVYSAIEVLVELQAMEYSKEIAGLLKRRDMLVGRAIYALARLGAKEYTNDIAGVLKDRTRYYEYRTAAARALAQFGAVEYVDEIAELLHGGEFQERMTAASALAQLGARQYAKDIAALLNDPYPSVRAEAMEALFQLGAKEYAQDIAHLLKDEQESLRGMAQQVLRDWGIDPWGINPTTSQKGRTGEQPNR